jgi:hypothetical protein
LATGIQQSCWKKTCRMTKGMRQHRSGPSR